MHSDLRSEFVTYEIALLLKQAGFNEPCLAGFGAVDSTNQYEDKEFSFNQIVGSVIDWNTDSQGTKVSAPTWEQAKDWLRANKSPDDKIVKMITWAERLIA